MDCDVKYGDLSKDKDFVDNCENLMKNLQEVQKVLDQLLPLKQHYDKMTLPSKIELDIFLAFTLTSLNWVDLRIQGIDPSKHPIKDELDRIKNVMMKWQEYKDREKRPTVDIEAAKRFVRSGLYDPYKNTAKPQNKKSFDD